jgi:hypothetical protein
MQIVTSYPQSEDSIKLVQQFRLYHLSNSWLKKWRQARHNKSLPFDKFDNVVLSLIDNNQLTVVDSAGWYFGHAGIKVTCLESTKIAKCYYPDCNIEYDVMTHRPTYISDQNIVFFKFPWFLKYATFDCFINFLNIWVKSVTIIAFNPILIQHNHLKFKLIDLVKNHTLFNITEVNDNLWIITP